MSVFDKYSRYYNTMYQDKDYEEESEYIHKIIQEYQPITKTILDLGCGTGRHAKFLVKRGYRIHGIDISQKMIGEAKRIERNKKNLVFSVGDIKSVNLNNTFESVISLFHVISYQTNNEDLQKAFSTVYNHPKDRGLFIFDCWYGHAVLTEQPTERVKTVENNNQKIIKFTKPIMHVNNNIVEVRFHFFVLNKQNRIVEEFMETHLMRYLFKPELGLILNSNGFILLKYNEFLTYNEPNYNSWSVCFIKKRNKINLES